MYLDSTETDKKSILGMILTLLVNRVWPVSKSVFVYDVVKYRYIQRIFLTFDLFENKASCKNILFFIFHIFFKFHFLEPSSS